MARCGFVYFLLLLSLFDLEANPSDPTVVSGQASCISTPEKLEITAHDKTIISWKDFSIGSKETTRFNLPNSRSVILNRVGSHNPSKIEGLLSSNGIVYLLNKNGILITPSGKIETAGFLASTLDISDQDFLSGGDILFTGSSGSITNLGAIQCSSGDVILIASQLKNDGTIEAPDGKIALGAAQEILMTLQGEERLTVRLSTPDSKEEVGIRQTGTLKALQAELKADGNLFAYAIKNEGHIHAATAVRKDGRIYLVAEKGLVASSGTLTAPGGEVRMLGQIASLTDQAQIDVSHDTGGGTVLIGGDYQGKNPGILNAQMTYVGPDVVILAGALQSGQGGKVIAWADGETFFYGKINAPGGPLAGNGGFAEVSGKHNLDFLGLVDLSAPQGKTGMLLLDPTNVTFSTAADSGFAVIPPTCISGYGLSGAPATANVNIANLLTNLGTCSVTISTAVATGSVTLSSGSPLNWTGTTTNTLTVNATSTLTFSDALTNSTTGGSMTWTGTAVSIAGPITNSSTSGNITITGTGAVTQTAAGTITNTSTSGALNISGSTITLTNAAIQNGPLTGATAATPTISIIGSAGGSFGAAAVPMTSNTAAGGGITLSGFTSIGINGPVTNGPTSGGPSGAGTISMFCSGAFTQAVGGPILNNSATGGMTLDSSGSSITLNDTLTSNSTGLSTLTAGVNITTASSNSIAFNAGSLVITAVGGAITTSGLINFAAGAGSLTMSAATFINLGAGITFASTAGSMSLSGITNGGTGQSAVFINAPLIFNSPNTCSITSTGVGSILNSALGTITFNAGSLVMTTTENAIGINALINFTAGAGSLTMSAATFILIEAGITFASTAGSMSLSGITNGGTGQSAVFINAPLIFNSPNTCSITSTGVGSILNSTLGTITFNAGSLVMTTTENAIGINALINFTAGAGSLTMSAATFILIEAGITFASTAGSMSLSGITNGGTGQSAVFINAPLIFNSPNTCSITSTGVGSILNSTLGTITFNAGSLVMTTTENAIGINALIHFTAGAGSLTMSAATFINLEAGITFASTAGSMSLSGVTTAGPNSSAVYINAPLIFSGSDTGSIISNGSGQIYTTSLGTIQINAGAGPFTIRTLTSAINLSGAVTHSGSLLTIDPGATTTFNALLTNSSTATGTSLVVNGGGIAFGASPGGFTSSASGASNFTSAGSFSTNASSTFSTSGSGSVSITSASGISIPGSLTLGSSGAFSATALGGTVNINGSISSTAGGAFTVSAPNAATAVTINGTSPATSSFAAGSIVNISSNGSTGGITLGSSTANGMTFAAGAGSLTVSSTGPININGPLSYSYTGPCQFLGTGASGSIANNASGAMTFLSGCGDATFQSTRSTVTFNAAAQVQFQSGAGNAFVTTNPGTGSNMTIGLFDFESGPGKAATFNSNAALTFGANFTYGTSSGTCNMTSFGLLTYGPGTLALNTSALNMTSTAGGITTTSGTGLITVNALAGALTMNAFGTITIGAALANNSSTSPLTMLATSPSGNIAINGAITTSGNGNVNATAGVNITLGAGITYTQAVGTGTFIAGQADSLGLFSTTATSPLGTSGSGILSITSANAAGSAAITIAGALTLASSGSFSATATTGNAAITGAITTSGGGAFSASALGPAGTVTLSTAATNSFTGSAVSLMAGTGGVTLSTTNTTFAAGAGSLTVNSVGPVAINTALTYASTGSCQFISTGGSITSNASGIMNFNAGSGAASFTANTIAGQAITIGAAITNSSANSLTTTSSGTTTFNALLTNNSTLSATPSLIVNAGENIAFGASPAGFTSGSPGASNFTANTAALGSFSTVAGSSLATTSTAGAVSITAANATGANAISILCPITLASSGSFSATATTGNVLMSGTITNTTASGVFNVSAPGESGAITLSNTIDFNPGSAVTLASAGLTTLSGAAMTFGSGAGSFLTVGTLIAPVGSIAINGTLNYSSPGACQFIASGSITNSAAGIMNFSGGPVTFKSTASTITFNATPAITFNSGAGALSVSTIGGGAITLGGPFVFNTGSSSTASFNSSGPLSVNGTFTYNVSSGTCSLLSAGLLTLNNTLNLNAGSLSMQSTGSGITTTASGPITVAIGAGPLTMNAVGTITLGSTLNDLSSTLLTMTTTSTIGDILINAALTTSGNATLSAARNLTFGAAIPYTQSAGTGNLLAGQAAEGLFSISSLLSTSGSAALSITSSNAPASNAITIRAMTLSSTGAFSATATQGFVSISGNISSTAGAPFSVSAPGTAGAIIISSPTVSFTPGSVVNLAAAGNTSLSGTSTFGSGGSGSLAISGNTAGVSISGPLTYDSTGAFQISSTGSTIRTTPAGTITVNAGTGLTMTANGLITVGGTVLYNSSDVNGFTAASSAGGITITAPITVTTAAPLAFSATTAGQQVLIQNQVLNSSTGPITVTTSNLTLEPVAGSTTSAELGTLSGALALTNVTQVALIGGTAAGAFAQLGYNPTGASSNITFTNCHSLSLEPGTASNCYTLLGHGSPSSASTVTGNITISGTGNLTMGTSGNGTNCFSQIGHVQSSAGTTASGDIAVTLGGSISMTGGDNTNTYALIGHGGGPSGSTNSYTGNVAVQAGGDIVLRTNSSGTNAFAAIGPAALSTGTVTITGDATPVISAASTGGSIVLQSAPNNECVIGAYIRGGSSNTINPFTISVAAGQDLILTGAPNPGAVLNGALIGALAYTGAVPFAASGTSTSTLNITVGRNLEMQTSSGPANALTFTAIQNGLGGASNPITLNVTGAASLLGGNNISTITSLGALTLTAAGDVTVLSDQTTGSAGAATIQGSGNTSVSGSGVTVTGYIGGPEALIQTAAGNLSVSSHFMTLASNGNILLTAGAGTLTVNAAVGDLNLNDLASIQNQGSGPTLMTVGGTVGLTAGAGNAMIAGNTGTLTMNITGNLNLITNTGGSASITSNGPISAAAQNIALSGLGAGQQSLIQTTMGDLLLMAMNDITLDDNALIANTGSGNVTLVADQQAPLPPLIGPGRFILNPNAAITAMGGALLQVFTARPNGITAGNLAFGQLNGNYVTTGFVCPFDRPIPSAENQYDTYYDLFLLGGADPAALGAGTTYTIFYKVPFIPPTPPVPPTPTPVPVVPTPVLQRNLGKIIYASSQIFWVLREYPVYRSDETAFFLNCKICRKRSRKFGKFCMDVDDRYPYIHQNWTRYPIGL